MTTPDQGSGTRPRVSDERLQGRIERQAAERFKHAGIDEDIALDLQDARATLARYEAALRDLVDYASKADATLRLADESGPIARARALSSGGSGEAKGREA